MVQYIRFFYSPLPEKALLEVLVLPPNIKIRNLSRSEAENIIKNLGNIANIKTLQSRIEMIVREGINSYEKILNELRKHTELIEWNPYKKRNFEYYPLIST